MGKVKFSAVLPIAAAFTVLAVIEFLYFPGKSQEAHERALRAKAVAVSELTAHSTGPALDFDDKQVVEEYSKAPRVTKSSSTWRSSPSATSSTTSSTASG
jgi:hypothetical protein